MSTSYIGYAVKRIAFYQDRGRIAEYWQPETGRWKEEEGRVPGMVVGYCPKSCVIYDREKIPNEVLAEGALMEVCRYTEPPKAEESKKPSTRYGR